MSRNKSKHKPFFRNKIKEKNKEQTQVQYLLESGNIKDMRALRSHTKDLLAYHWKFFSELEYQRNQYREEINEALVSSCLNDFSFSQWQRAVRWKYGLHPLSTVGSEKFIGQRFNIGESVNPSANSFPSLYIAEDKATALQEALGQPPKGNKGFSAQELALMNPQSEVVVSVSGKLESAIDLRKSKSVSKFVKVIKKFKLSKEIKKEAARLEQPIPELLVTNKKLIDSLLEYEWRLSPSNFDIPSNSQIFGYLAYVSGIEGVVYPSKLSGKSCLAIYSRNFKNTGSYIEFDDAPPLETIPRRFDALNFDILDREKI